MEVYELDNDSRNAILKEFRQSSLYQGLLKKQRRYVSRNMLNKAAEMNEYIITAEKEYLEAFCAHQSDNIITAAELSQRMAPEHFERVAHNWHVINFLADMLNSKIFDTQEVLKHYENQFCFEGILSLKKATYILSQVVEHGENSRSAPVDELYGNTICSMEDRLDARVETFVRRVAEIDKKYRRKVARENAQREKENEKK